MPGLPLQPDELEDVGEPEVLDRPFEGHAPRPGASARAAAAAGARARMTSKSGRTRLAAT